MQGIARVKYASELEISQLGEITGYEVKAQQGQQQEGSDEAKQSMAWDRELCQRGSEHLVRQSW